MSTKVAVIGPAAGEARVLTETIQWALSDPSVRQVIYLGDDDVAAEAVSELLKSSLSPSDFWTDAANVALRGSTTDIEALLDAEARGRRLSCVRSLPEAPARAVEMLERWILLAVHDKAILDEDDIANAHVVLYGKSQEPAFKRFGRRCFFCPGPLSKGNVGFLELMPEGDLKLMLTDLSGAELNSETLKANSAKLVVTT